MSSRALSALLAGLVLALAGSPTIAQPTNDQFTSSTTVSEMTNFVSPTGIVWQASASGTDVLATRSQFDPSLSGLPTNTSAPTVWWNWTAPTNGVARILVSSSNYIYSGVFIGSSISNLVKITQSSGGSTLPADMRFQVRAGTRFEIMTERFNEPTRPINLEFYLVQAPGNDDFSERIRVAGDSLSFTGVLGSATVESGEFVHGFRTGYYQSLWWEWTAPSSGNVMMTLIPQYLHLTPPRIGVFTGTEVNALTLVTNGGGPGLPLRITFGATSGVPYKFSVSSGSANVNPFRIELTRNRPPEISWISPTNNQTFDYGGHFSAEVIATDSDGSIERVAFSFNGASVELLTSPPYRTSIGPLDIGTHALIASTVDSGGLVTSAVRFLVDVPHANDRFAERTVLSGFPVETRGTNAGATLEPGEPLHAGQPGFGSAWWRWVSPFSGPAVVALRSERASSRLAVYQGTSVNSLISVVSANGGSSATNLFVRFDALEGNEYQIAVDSGRETGTRFSLMLLPPPTNDFFANRIRLLGDAVVGASYNYGATTEVGETPSEGFAANRSVWWTWRSPYTHRVHLSTFNNFKSWISVYTGTSINNLREILNRAVFSSPGQTTLDVVEGVDYHFAVDSWFDDVGDVRWQLRPANAPAILAPSVSQDSVSFALLGLSNRFHTIELSTNLTLWEPLRTLRLDGSSNRLTIPKPEVHQSTPAFFRLRLGE